MTIYDLLERVISHLGQVSPQLIDEFRSKQTAIITVLLLWQLGFTLLVFVVSIFFTHKVAGPIYKTMQFLKGIRNGERGKLKFRGGDHFMELADEINVTMDHIHNDRASCFEHLVDVRNELKSMPGELSEQQQTVLDSIDEKLSKII